MRSWAAVVVAGLAAAVPSASLPATAPASAVAGRFTVGLSLLPSTAPGNTLVTVTGRTTGKGQQCELWVDAIDLGSCTVADGTVSGAFTVPLTLAVGNEHRVVACVFTCVPTDPAAVDPQARITVPRRRLDPLTAAVQAPGRAGITGEGFSPGGVCRLTAGQIHAECKVGPDGRLSGTLPVTAITPTRGYPVDAVNIVGSVTQSASVTLQVLGTTPPTTPTPASASSITAAPTTTAPTGASPTRHTSAATGPTATPRRKRPPPGPDWRTIAAWSGGAGGGLLLSAATFAAFRWRRRRAHPARVRAGWRSELPPVPRLVALPGSRVHSVQLRLRTGPITFDDPRTLP